MRIQHETKLHRGGGLCSQPRTLGTFDFIAVLLQYSSTISTDACDLKVMLSLISSLSERMES